MTHPGHSNDPRSTCALSRFRQIMSHAIGRAASGSVVAPGVYEQDGETNNGRMVDTPPAVSPRKGQNGDPRVLNK